jgi:hypothetical protein
MGCNEGHQDFSQVNSGAHTASCPMDIMGSFRWGKDGRSTLILSSGDM